MYSPATEYIASKVSPGKDCTEVDTGYATPCWIWRKAKTSAGYGMVTISRKQYYVHILNYVERYGVPPDGTEMDHLCRMRACARPDHIEAVTHTENVRRGSRSKLTPEIIVLARGRYHAGESIKDLALEIGIDSSTLGEAISGKIWKGVQ